jgi:hypothetical protein
LKEWERGFLEYAGSQFPQVGEAIRKEKVLSKETEADLRRAIEGFNGSRQKSQPAAPATQAKRDDAREKASH